jgi:beta-lactamase regulating signal transducer with metallopeptidase domain
MNNEWLSWDAFAIRAVIGSTLILCFGLVAIWILRRQSAATKHLVGTFTIGALLLLPSFIAVLPSWELGWIKLEKAEPILSSLHEKGIEFSNKEPGRSLNALGSLDKGTQDHAGASLDSITRQISFPMGSAEMNNGQALRKSLPTDGSPIANSNFGADTATNDTYSDLSRFSMMLLWIYVSGVAIGLLRMLLDYRIVSHLIAQATKVTDERQLNALNSCRNAFSLRRDVECRITEKLNVPIVAGIFRAIVLLPKDTIEWSTDQLTSAVAHEMAHVARYDVPIQLFVRIVGVLYWPQPLVLLISKIMRNEREAACDDLVINRINRPTEYAQHLLAVAAGLAKRDHTSRAALAMARCSNVEQRIQSILSATRCRTSPTRRIVVTMLTLSIVCLLMTVMFNPLSRVMLSEATAQDEQATRVSGAITLPDQKPVVGSRVYLLKVNGGSFTLPTQPGITETDGSGNYTFEGVKPGTYRIWAETSELTTLENKLEGKVIKVEADSPVLVVNLSMHEGCKYNVKVIAKEDAKPVANATVSFGWTDIVRNYKTGSDGVVKIGGLGRDDWYFVVKADGFATTYRRLPKQSLGSSTDLEFQLAPGCDLEGRVVNEKGHPIAGAKVRANETSASMTPGFGEAVSDENGRFLLKSLPRGDAIRLQAGKENHESFYSEVSMPQDEKSFKYDITLQTMAYGGDCIVTVINEKGTPIADASLENMGDSSKDVRTAKTDSEGKARLANLFKSWRGTTAVIRARGYITQRVALQTGTQEAPGEIEVKMVSGEKIRGRLLKPDGQPAANIRVYYDRGEQGFSLGGRVDTDREGRFFAEGLPNPCTFTFYTVPPFAPIRDRKLPVGGDVEVVVQMEMEAVIRLRAIDASTKKPIPEFNVKIGFPTNGNRVSGSISSSLMNPGTEILGEAKEFRLGQLTPGNQLNCTVSAKGYVKSLVENVEAVVEDGSKPLDVELRREDPSMFWSVAGKLFDTKGDPVPAALVRVMVLDPKFANGISDNWTLIETEQIAMNASCLQFSKTTTSKDGAFRLDRVQKDGVIVLAFSGKDIANKLLRVPEHYQAEDMAGLECEATLCGKLKVTVDQDTFPDADSVSLQPTTRGILLGYTSKKITTKDSQVAFENVPPGSYRVVLQSKPLELGTGGFTNKSIKTMNVIIREGEVSEEIFQ